MRTVKIKKGNRTIAGSVNYLDGMFRKAIGMMFHTKGKMLLVTEKDSIANTAIHTLFCFPLLVAWINSKNMVVDVRRTIPFWFYAPKKPAKYVFETSDMKTKIKIGDKVRFIEEK